MRFPADAVAWLRRRYERQHREWLGGEDAGRWPLGVALGVPTEQAALRQPDAVQQWVAAWHDWAGPGHVQWTERAWRSLGRQQVPERLVLDDAAAVAALLGEAERWQRARERYGLMVGLWPRLAAVLPRHFDMLADYAETDFQRLVALLAWLIAHPGSGLYPRQLPVAGLDTKWLERRQGMIADLLAAARGEETGDMYALAGLRQPPAVARLRLLDPQLRSVVGGLGDVTAPWPELAALPIAPRAVIVVENVQTGLALLDLPGTVAFIGLGYGVSALANVPWLASAQLLYWGDLDTHGFAILSQLRTHWPAAESLLMDEATLLAHRTLWVAEPRQHAAETLPGLTAGEQAVYADLKQQRWGHHVRLEQERIAWDVALAVIRRVLGTAVS